MKASKIILWILRISVGLLFIFSGFVKADDPLGFSYKLQEYFEVFHFEFLNGIAIYLSMIMSTLEMILGALLIFGIRMNFTMWLMLILIIFFTFLTAYSYITGKITDCGCFGDAIKLTNSETFWKDVILLILVILLFLSRKTIIPVFGNMPGNIIAGLTIAVGIFFTLYCYRHLPLIDFRAYKAGNNIRQQMTLPPGKKPDQYVTILTYKDKSSGKQEKYVMASGSGDDAMLKAKGLQPLPWQDSVWMNNHDFVSSNSEIIVKGDKPAITDFHVWDNDNNDVTSQVLDQPNYHFWIVAYDMETANKKSFAKIEKLSSSCEQHNIPFTGLTATPYNILDPIRHNLNAAFPFYYADGTVLKTIIRSNPGLILLKGPVVLAQWHYNDIPAFEEVNIKYLTR
ncbi:MAG: DoxX family protein [Chitinophagales bacterium]|nr:DoxX family protein [Chitinophagales bacterium]